MFNGELLTPIPGPEAPPRGGLFRAASYARLPGFSPEEMGSNPL